MVPFSSPRPPLPTLTFLIVIPTTTHTHTHIQPFHLPFLYIRPFLCPSSLLA
jgi:hypothetical protein